MEIWDAYTEDQGLHLTNILVPRGKKFKIFFSQIYRVSNFCNLDSGLEESKLSEARGCFVICSLSDPKSIQNANNYAEYVRYRTKDNEYPTYIYLIGNKKQESEDDEDNSRLDLILLFYKNLFIFLAKIDKFINFVQFVHNFSRNVMDS